MTAAACGKQRIADRTKADRARKALRDRGVQGAHVYRCTSCRAWHVGSNRGTPPASVRDSRPGRPA